MWKLDEWIFTFHFVSIDAEYSVLQKMRLIENNFIESVDINKELWMCKAVVDLVSEGHYALCIFFFLEEVGHTDACR